MISYLCFLRLQPERREIQDFSSRYFDTARDKKCTTTTFAGQDSSLCLSRSYICVTKYSEKTIILESTVLRRLKSSAQANISSKTASSVDTDLLRECCSWRLSLQTPQSQQYDVNYSVANGEHPTTVGAEYVTSFVESYYFFYLVTVNRLLISTKANYCSHMKLLIQRKDRWDHIIISCIQITTSCRKT